MSQISLLNLEYGKVCWPGNVTLKSSQAIEIWSVYIPLVSLAFALQGVPLGQNC